MATTKVTTGGITDATIATADIADSAVTYAKIENLGQNQVLGRVASGSGAATNLPAADVRTLINVEDGATADQTASEIKTLLQSDKLTNSEIADQTVTLDKLPHGTSSNDGKFLRANNGADPTFETVSSVGGGTGVGFNDSVKVQLGTDNDLRLFYNGSDSLIQHHDATTGNDLHIQSDTKTIFGSVGGAETHAVFDDDGACELYHNNSKKIETTTNGATVTGTVAQTVLPSWCLRPNAASNQTSFPHSSFGHTIGWSANTSGSSAKACHLSGGVTLGAFTGSPVGNGYKMFGGNTVGKLTVPLAGKYYVWTKLRTETASGAGDFFMYVNGVAVAREYTSRWAIRAYETHAIEVVLDLAANDYIEIVVHGNNMQIRGYNDTVNWFGGHYIG